MRNATTAVTALAPPWGMAVPGDASAQFHVLLDASGWLMIEGKPPLAMSSGDVVVLAPGVSHRIADDPSSICHRPFPLPGSGDHLLGSPSTPPQGLLVCGRYTANALESHPVLSGLPQVLHVRGDSANGERLGKIIELLGDETRATGGGGPPEGSDLVVDRLLDVLLIEVVRAWIIDRNTCPVGWLRGLGDAKLRPVLGQLHTDPAKDWTVARLAALAGLSRATFAKHFAAVVGEPPMTYLRRWRLLVAADLLRSTDLSLDAISHQVGYATSFAFSRAFSQEHGVAPSIYRRS